ncbi:MAG: hypothetical protein H6657_31970 [Ardenticatenaceae bacterium]|nr:hypothetical protein [Ardenticatenaceae bacterium]MCB8982046.1 hypothetical protein [Ardenticatenaceae bacterium]
MKLNCPKCGTEILAENMNLERMVAKCTNCHSIFTMADQLKTTNTNAKLPAPQPSKVVLENLGGGLRLHWTWFSWQILMITGFAIFWNGILFFGFGGAMLSDGASPFTIFPLFILPHFWVGLGMIYYALTGYINKTTVTVDYGQLTVRHGPLPWWGNKSLEPVHIVQLYTKENRSSYRRNNYWSGNFELHAILKQGKHQKLLSGLDSSEHALFVEQTIEEQLGIEDYPVRGEYGR